MPRAKKIKEDKTEQLISFIFHEVRRPLSSMKGYASLLVTEEVGKLDTQQKEIAKKIIDLADYLASLLTGYLHFSEIDIKKSVKERVWIEWPAFFKRIINSVALDAEKKNIDVILKLPKQANLFWGREGDLNHIFANLLHNAIRFSYPNSSIMISLTEKDGFFEARVQDKGIGVPEGVMHKLFDPFYHIDSPQTGAMRGTGLGLTIVKRLVEGYGGKIWLESKEGKGATSIVRLPALDKEEAFKQHIKALIDEAALLKKHVSLLLIQLTNWSKFKSIKAIDANRRHDILQSIEKKIASGTRTEDRMFYFEEKKAIFAMALPNTDQKGAVNVQNRIEELLKKESIEISIPGADAETTKLSFKFAIATVPKDGKTKERLFAVGEKRLR